MGSDKEHKKISDIPKKDIFTTPEGYFESLQGRIDKRIAKKGKPEAKILGLPAERVKYISLAIAASVLLLMLFLPSRQSNPASPSAADLIAQISDQDCMTFLKNSDIEIDDMLSLAEPELWEDALDNIPNATDSLDQGDLDLLYEQYGVSPDENLQMF